MHSPDAVWNALVGYAVQHETVETLARGSENDLVFDSTADEILVENGEPYRLDREQIERVWSVAADDGHLRRENTREAMGAFRASVLLALLAQAFDLPYETRPVTVYMPEHPRRSAQ